MSASLYRVTLCVLNELYRFGSGPRAWISFNSLRSISFRGKFVAHHFYSINPCSVVIPPFQYDFS